MDLSRRKGNIKKMVLSVLLGNLLSIVIALILLSMLSGFFSEGGADWFLLLVGVWFYLFFTYHEGWLAGTSDANLIKFGKVSKTPWKGLGAGALAAIPGMIFAILSVVLALSGRTTISILGQDLIEVIYRLWFLCFSPAFPAFERVALMRFIPPLLMPLACGAGYWMGLRRICIHEMILYKKDKNA